MNIFQLNTTDYALGILLTTVITAHVFDVIQISLFDKFVEFFSYTKKPSLGSTLLRLVPLSGVTCVLLNYNLVTVTIMAYFSALYFMSMSAIDRSRTRNRRKTI